ncbi:MAG: hypothetical protein J5806_09645 [Lentisphaeria bacterium]|nr:hypothetical protein [Lentisphaeria bacterium]
MDIVIFGDESLEVTVFPLLEKLELQPVFVYDPKREAAVEFFTRGPGRQYPAFPHPGRAGREAFVRQMADLHVPFALICSYSRIIWKELREVFPFGIANIHGAKLPEYRGASVLQWAIINGETETAVTLHYIDDGVDTGPIIGQRPIPITDRDTSWTVRDRIIEETVVLLETYLPKLVRGPVPAEPQDGSRAATWPRRHPEDSRIDWSWSDQKISDLTRAMVPPLPAAFYFDRDGVRRVIDRILTPAEVHELRSRL